MFFGFNVTDLYPFSPFLLMFHGRLTLASNFCGDMGLLNLICFKISAAEKSLREQNSLAFFMLLLLTLKGLLLVLLTNIGFFISMLIFRPICLAYCIIYHSKYLHLLVQPQDIPGVLLLTTMQVYYTTLYCFKPKSSKPANLIIFYFPDDVYVKDSYKINESKIDSVGNYLNALQ